MPGANGAMPKQSDSIAFSVLAIALMSLFVIALGRNGAWLLLLIVLAMLVRSRITQGV